MMYKFIKTKNKQKYNFNFLGLAVQCVTAVARVQWILHASLSGEQQAAGRNGLINMFHSGSIEGGGVS